MNDEDVSSAEERVSLSISTLTSTYVKRWTNDSLLLKTLFVTVLKTAR